MSKVKLRSRCYKLSKAETANLCNQTFVKHNLRSSDGKVDKSQIYSSHIQSNIKESVHFQISTADKTSDNGAIETSSMKSQSTSQLSSGISLESLDFCKWEDCSYDFITYDNPLCNQSKTVMSDELEKHLLEYHVKSQLTSKRKYFQCLWHECKVYKQKSLSYSWLERHVIDHTDNKTKPFSCIFDCHMRFTSQIMLEKHVQMHIDDLHGNITSDSVNINNELIAKKSLPISKKTNKHLNSYHVHRPDFIDYNTITQIKTEYMLQNIDISPDLLDRYDLKYLQLKPLPNSLIRLLTLEFKIMGRRVCGSRHQECLIEWVQPYNLSHNVPYQSVSTSQSEWIDDNLVQLAECLSQKTDPC